MFPLLAEMNHLWYSLPLVVGVSLVYAATRHEEMGPILRHAMGFGRWTLIFMILAGVVLETFAYFQ